MTVRAGLQAIGLLTAIYLLFLTFAALGPLGWLFFGALLVIGLVQGYRGRTREGVAEDGETGYCPECGAPIAPDSEHGSDARSVNCDACGAPNDPKRTTCEYCDATL
ncbi:MULTISPECIES: zinc ribbon domain-containing protein [Natrialbaceae]|uniref:zinc ribbon domain-containing protein n=1 Tax=Natrialbaceae TaxID=1644061 RepID=UPI00207CB7F2|nr:zinc ribbon domain-containing protein [Natronococcus sp. CG52]